MKIGENQIGAFKNQNVKNFKILLFNYLISSV